MGSIPTLPQESPDQSGAAKDIYIHKHIEYYSKKNKNKHGNWPHTYQMQGHIRVPHHILQRVVLRTHQASKKARGWWVPSPNTGRHDGAGGNGDVRRGTFFPGQGQVAEDPPPHLWWTIRYQMRYVPCWLLSLPPTQPHRHHHHHHHRHYHNHHPVNFGPTFQTIKYCVKLTFSFFIIIEESFLVIVFVITLSYLESSLSEVAGDSRMWQFFTFLFQNPNLKLVRSS